VGPKGPALERFPNKKKKKKNCGEMLDHLLLHNVAAKESFIFIWCSLGDPACVRIVLLVGNGDLIAKK
jgi:hypothetical protein